MSNYSSDSFVAHIHNEKNVTREDILKEADIIWEKCKNKKLSPGDTEAADKYLEELRKEHKEFSTSYPIVLRYMVHFHSYMRKSLNSYLKRIEVKPWTSEAEYLDSQTDYVVTLYKDTNPKWNRTHVSTLKKNIRTMLENESKQFKNYLNVFEKEVNEEETMLKKEYRSEVENYFKKLLEK